jgi:hypothetical protein
VLAIVNAPLIRFKLAEVGEPHGTLDQDRLAAVRGVEGVFPALTDIDSFTESPDLGTSRVGETKVALRDAMPFVTAFHTLSNLDVVYDGIRGGSSRISWVATGHREDGTPFTVTREDMYHSGFDITFESIFEMWFDLESLVFFPDETVTFDSVDIEGSVTEEDLRATIVKVLTKSTLQPVLKERTTLRAAPGTDITVRAILERADGSTFPVDLTLRVPKGRRADGILRVKGMGSSGFGFFGPDNGEPPDPVDEEPETIDSIIEDIEGAPHAFDLVATLFPSSPVFKKQKTLAQDEIVLGTKVVQIDVVA